MKWETSSGLTDEEDAECHRNEAVGACESRGMMVREKAAWGVAIRRARRQTALDRSGAAMTAATASSLLNARAPISPI